jgi:hypothetical protein
LKVVGEENFKDFIDNAQIKNQNYTRREYERREDNHR